MQTGGTGGGGAWPGGPVPGDGPGGDGPGGDGPAWPHPPAGWYPDPAGDGARWWDGYAWTGHTAPVPAGAQPPGGGGATSAGPGSRWRWDPAGAWRWMPAWAGYGDWPERMRPLVDAERRIGAVARWAILALAAVAVGITALRIGYGNWFATYVHWLRVAWHAAQVGARAPTPPAVPAGYLTLVYLGGLVEAAAGVLFLVWQHRAASAARWLGLPGRHTPAWGIAFWFIPVANLWCPYQALRDCLPPGHPGRRLVLGCWLLYLGTGVTTLGAYVAAAFSRPAGVAVLVLLAVLWLSVLVLGRRLVTVVADAHRAIVGA